MREFILVVLLECWNRAMSIKPVAQSLSIILVFFGCFLFCSLPLALEIIHKTIQLLSYCEAYDCSEFMSQKGFFNFNRPVILPGNLSIL